MFAYYRKFIKDFSKIAAPLYRHAGKGVQNKRGKNKEIILEEDAKEAFAVPKKAITESPVMLMFPERDKPFEIHCDASTGALGAILIQVIDKKERVIMYASRTLNVTERKYQVSWSVWRWCGGWRFLKSTLGIQGQWSGQTAVHYSG